MDDVLRWLPVYLMWGAVYRLTSLIGGPGHQEYMLLCVLRRLRVNDFSGWLRVAIAVVVVLSASVLWPAYAVTNLLTKCREGARE